MPDRLFSHPDEELHYLQKEVERLRHENRELNGELYRISADAQQNHHTIQHLRSLVKQLEEERHSLLGKLEEKEDVLNGINADIEHFHRELNILLSHFQANQAQTFQKSTDAAADFLDDACFGENRDMMFGVNIEEQFILESSLETLKYFLYAVNAYEYAEFELPNLRLRDRSEMHIIGQALSKYMQSQSRLLGFELQGIVEFAPPALFDPQKVRFRGTSSESALRLFSQFSAQFRLDGELDFISPSESQHA